MKYDLEERTIKFAESIINLCKKVSQNPITLPIINQLIKAATSIGANYMEADGAESKKDFQHKIALCKKEAKETKHWLRMIAKANPQRVSIARDLWKEAQELALIFSSILIAKKKE